MENRASLATGVGIGAALMYWLDPDRGRRRRALVRDRAVHLARIGRDAAGATGRDLSQRGYGTAASVAGALRPRTDDDDVLVARVRSKLGRVSSHPHAVEVTANSGVVTLRGPILEGEAPRVVKTARSVRGVRNIVDELDRHSHPGDVPALQGQGAATGARMRGGFWQEQWSPTTRLLMGGLGAGLLAYCGKRRDTPAMLAGTVGAAMVARALINVDVARITGLSESRRAVDIRKTITIDAPVAVVFEFWREYENFPRFMSRVLEVRDVGPQSHWIVSGPAGMPVSFDTEITRMIPNQVLAWRTVPGSTVAHAGLVNFESLPGGRTRVSIHMSYNPPGGWLGHGVAAVFGVDPKSSIDADLVRMKTLIEAGRTAHDAAKPAGGLTPEETQRL